MKRVTQELGGKSPNIILDDADFEKTIAREEIFGPFNRSLVEFRPMNCRLR